MAVQHGGRSKGPAPLPWPPGAKACSAGEGDAVTCGAVLTTGSSGAVPLLRAPPFPQAAGAAAAVSSSVAAPRALQIDSARVERLCDLVAAARGGRQLLGTAPRPAKPVLPRFRRARSGRPAAAHGREPLARHPCCRRDRGRARIRNRSACADRRTRRSPARRFPVGRPGRSGAPGACHFSRLPQPL